ncbi:MAG: aryl-sulfate sulfotransferase, partial [Nocardioidaceae bacterium]
LDLVNTDGHDSILKADGGRILVGYEDNLETGKIDATIQEVDPQGDVVFTWNSKEYIDPAVDSVVPLSNKDYAHINSIFIMDDGDILASFRHLSQVLKIAWSDHDGYARGDIVWRLGGRHSDFTFVDDPYPGGPCAQHTASQLPGGDILLFDNGSWSQGGRMCIDPADPSGPTVERTLTRISQYSLDEDAGTATRTWGYQVPNRFALFAGSAERLANGNTLVGWAAEKKAMAAEVSPAGEVLWEIRDAAATTEPPSRPVYFTYRALKFAAPDAIDPQVSLSVPAPGATYTVGRDVPVRYTCTDRGGSSLRSCGGSALPGEAVDTSKPGTHTFTVRAKDGNGNVTKKVRTYTVTERYRPDAQIRRGTPGSRFVGDDIYGDSSDQRIRQRIERPGRSVTAFVKLQNDGTELDRLRLRGTRGADAFRIAYFAGADNVTGRVTSGDFRTPRLGSGEHFVLRVRVTRTRAADVGDTRTTKVRAASLAAPLKTDTVATVVRAAR